MNATSVDLLDVRTPPKYQQKIKSKPQIDFENSHAGIAIPVDEEALELEATTRKLNFFKYGRPTTNSGLSTWILLSGQSSTVKTTTKKPVIKPATEETLKENITIAVDPKPNRVVKPLFKKKPPNSATSSNTSITTATPTTTKPVPNTTRKNMKDTTTLTKIKASELNSAHSKKNISTTTINPIKKTTKASTVTTTKSTKVTTFTTQTTTSKPTTLETRNHENSTLTSSLLPLEAKDQDVEIQGSTESKKKPANKRKKNKTRRKKPEKSNTNLTNPINNKNNAMGSQIYSYLAKEIMPTVGAGLVGLMVTAGLATYFLYPFGAARRSDTDIDRRDKEGSYYYSDEYSGGMPEEEAIGKVIAGMSVSNLLSNTYKSPNSRNSYPITNSKYRLIDRRANIQPQKYEGFVKGSVENVPLGPDDYQAYKSDNDRKFVVGNVPKQIEEVTPVTVPEHGPRNLRLQKISSSDSELAPAYGPRSLRRRRRDTAELKENSEDFTEDPGKTEETPRRQRSGMSNDLFSDDLPADVDKNMEETKNETENGITFSATATTDQPFITNVPQETTSVSPSDSVQNFFNNIKYLLFLKARLALELFRNASVFFSDYISNVQNKVENNYKNFIKKHETVT